MKVSERAPSAFCREKNEGRDGRLMLRGRKGSWENRNNYRSDEQAAKKTRLDYKT